VKLFWSTFLLVFMAEVGDKTQIVGFTFASKGFGMAEVVLGSGLALSLSALLAVFIGDKIAGRLSEKVMRRLSGGLFIVIGLFFLAENFLH
jgi:putative Ca2+/H+ antiporter (TMEM165/GDT1 family)